MSTRQAKIAAAVVSKKSSGTLLSKGSPTKPLTVGQLSTRKDKWCNNCSVGIHKKCNRVGCECYCPTALALKASREVNGDA